jgi:hypothetical protein
MKRVTLTPSEFYTFKNLANCISLKFTYFVNKGWIFIDADELSLSNLGY